MSRSVIIGSMRHSVRRPPARDWPGQTRCGVDFHHARTVQPHPWNNFAHSRHGTATNRGATCLWCLMFDDILEE